MTIAFLPGLVVGAAVHTVAHRRSLWPRVGVLAWSLILACITAGTWLIGSGSLVFGYLFNFGYGKQAAESGALISPDPLSALKFPKHSILGLSAWRQITEVFLRSLSLPHALVLMAGILAAYFLALRIVKRHGVSVALNQLSHSPALPLFLIYLECVFALLSSRNPGSAFDAPTIPLAIVLSVWAISSCILSRFSRTIIASLGWAICLIASIPLADATWSFARPLRVNLPTTPFTAYVIDGRGTTFGGLGVGEAHPVGGYSYGVNNTILDSLTVYDRQAWLALINASSHSVRAISAANKGGLAFGFRHFLLNPNTIRLSSLMHGSDLPPLYMVAPVLNGDSISAYKSWLTSGEASGSSLLFTLSGEQGEFMPKVSKQLIEQAAKQAGFLPTQSWLAPTGQKLQLWKRLSK
jgi:hypothetical protein